MVRSSTEGVLVTKLFSELFMSLDRDDGPPGDVVISGVLRKLDSLIVIRGATVKLYVNGIYQESDTTDSSGRYQFVVDFDEGQYDVATSWEGNDTYLQDDSPLVTANYTKIQAAITITVSPSSGAPPLTVTIGGLLNIAATSSPLGGKTVNLWRSGGLVKSMTTKTTSPGQGSYSFSDIIYVSADYYVEFLGDDEYAGCEEGESLPCTVCGCPIPSAILGSEVECQSCHSVFNAVIM